MEIAVNQTSRFIIWTTGVLRKMQEHLRGPCDADEYGMVMLFNNEMKTTLWEFENDPGKIATEADYATLTKWRNFLYGLAEKYDM